MTKARAVRTDGQAVWTADEVEANRDRWAVGTPQRAGLELVYWTAARTVDAVLLGPDMIGRDGLLTFIQSKTGGRAYVPWTCRTCDGRSCRA